MPKHRRRFQAERWCSPISGELKIAGGPGSLGDLAVLRGGSASQGDPQDLPGIDPASSQVVFFLEPVHRGPMGPGDVPEGVTSPDLVILHLG